MTEHFQHQFDLFWKAYPLRISKLAAKKAFEKSLKITSLNEMLDGIERYKKGKPPYQEWCYPATWLNGCRWEDEFSNVPVKKSGAEVVILGKEYERVLQRIAVIRSQYSTNQTWADDDKTEIRKLKARRDELKVILGLTI